MAILPRQASTYDVYDDNSDAFVYKGNWTHYLFAGFYNNTFTATPTPGASFSFNFSGSEAYLYGGVLNISDAEGDDFMLSWPTADYTIDGTPAGSQKPHFDYGNTSIIYFQTPQLANGTHKIDVTVTTANDTNLYILDYFLVVPSPGNGNSGVQTTRNAPASTSSNPPAASNSVAVGPIVGGVVGGVAGIAILVILAWYFLFRRSRGGQAYYFDKPGAADVLAGEDQVEPFNAAPATATSPPPSSPGFGRVGPQSAYSDNSSSQPLNPSFRQTVVSSQPSQYTQSGPSEAGMTHVSGSSAQPRTGKAALIAQQYDNAQQPVQYQDSGVRFGQNGEQEPGPSQLPVDVPPTYTAE